MADWFDQQMMQDPAAMPNGGNYAQPRQRTPVNTAGITPETAPGRTTQGAPAPQPAGGAPTGGGARPYSDEALQAILQKYPATNAGMEQAMQEVNAVFGPGTVELIPHPTRLDKLKVPGGRIIDTIMSAGAPDASWGWIDETNDPRNANLTGRPVTGAMAGAMGGGAGGAAQAGTLGSLLGSPIAGQSQPDDPSFQWRIQQAQQGAERSAAAKGTLLTGGFAKALSRYMQDYAGTDWQNWYARKASEQGNTFNRLYQTANMGLGATQAGAAAGTSYAQNQGNLITQGGNAQAAGTIGQRQPWVNAVGQVANIYGQGGFSQQGGGQEWLDVGRGLY